VKKNKKILIVEDEVVIAMDLQSSVEKFGYTVSGHITRGEDVIAAIETDKPDIILMDVKLEGDLNGVEAALLVYEKYDIPVIFITSFSNAEIIDRAKRTNPYGYIVKPFNDRELSTNIEIAIYKHETELRLRESEKKYRDLAESIQQIIIECDLLGNIKYINQPGMQLLALSSDEFKAGVNLSNFIQHSSLEFIKWRITHHSLRDVQSLNREHLLINKYGKHYFIEEYLAPVYNTNIISGFRGILFDVTAKRLKETLNILYNRLTYLYREDTVDPMEIIMFLLAEFKKQFPYLEDVYFNEVKQDKRIITTHRTETITVRNYSHGHSETVVESKRPLYLRGSELEEFNEEHKIKAQDKKAVCWTGFPVNFQDKNFGVFAFQSFKNENALTLSDYDNLTLFFNNVNSLFDRISYLKYIKQSEAEYRHLVNSINEGLIRSDLKGNVTYVNKQFTQITGYSEEEVLGQNLITSIAINDKGRTKLKKELYERNKGLSNHYELQVTTKSGEIKELIINGSAFRNNNGKIVGSIATMIDVTEKKAFLRLIHDSEQKFKAIFDQAAVGVAIVNSKTGELIDINQKYCEIFRYTKEELLSMNIQEFTHPDDIEKDLASMNKLINGEIKEFSIEKRHFNKDGEVVWVNLTVSPLWNKGEEPSNHIAILENITKRKLIENALKESEEEKGNILRSMPDSFVVINKQGKIINSYFKNNESIIRKDLKTFINGKKWKDSFVEQSFHLIEEGIRTSFDKSDLFIRELELNTDNGINHMEIRFVPIHRDVLLIIRDITESKKNILEIQKFFNITEQTKELIMITDVKGKIEYVNPMFTEVTGYTLGDLRGKLPSAFKSTKHSKLFFKDLWQSILAGKTHKMTVTNCKKNGQLYIEEKIVTPIINKEGIITNFISTGRDITEEKKREKKILTYQKFEKTLEKKEQKYRTLALIQGQENERKRIARELHDGLGQMLTVVSANLESLNNAKLGSKERKTKAELVNQMMTEIIQESRRISHNLSPVGLYEFGLNAIIQQLVKRVKSNYQNITLNFASNLDDARFRPDVEINLYRIIQEALQNSLKHSKCKKINILLNYTNQVLKLKVQDDGIGFKIKQLENSNKHLNGIRNIEERAKIIDAKFEIESSVGKGFSIELELKIKKTDND